jgi:hypothetical protein
MNTVFTRVDNTASSTAPGRTGRWGLAQPAAIGAIKASARRSMWNRRQWFIAAIRPALSPGAIIVKVPSPREI